MTRTRLACAALALALVVVSGFDRRGSARAQTLPVADLAVIKTSLPPTTAPGGDITYTITVTNGGPSGAQGVALGDTLSPSTTFRSLTAPTGWLCQTPAVGSTGRVLCELPGLPAAPAGAPQVFTLVVRTAPGVLDGTFIYNAVDVRSGVLDPDPVNNTAATTTPVGIQADLMVTKTAVQAAVVPGAELAYTITVVNQGSSGAEAVRLADAVPAGTSFVSLAAPAGWTCDTPAAGAAGPITCTRGLLPALAPPQTFTLVVRVEAGTPAGSALANTATVSTATPDPVGTNDSATATARTGGRRLVVGAGAGAGPFVRSFDAATARELTAFFAFSPDFTGGVRVAVGDVNGDGVPDVIAGTGPGAPPEVRVFDGLSGATLRSFLPYEPGFTGGVFVAAGDVDGDGRADIVTGVDAGAGGGPHVRVFSSVSGAELRSFFPYGPGFTGGVRVGAGDVDGDGRANVITGTGPGASPHVKVFDGVTGAELHSFFAYGPSFSGGVFVAAGDVDGDGRADIITGAGAGAGAGPHVKAFDGRTGAEVRSFFAFGPAFTGGVRVAAGDVNRDGVADVIAAAETGSPLVSVFDGQTLNLLASFLAFAGNPPGGVFVATDAAAASEQVQLTSPAPGTVIARGALLRLAWRGLDGATAYGIEISGVGRQFANRRGTGPDPVNGFGGAGGGFIVDGTELVAVVPPALEPGTYEVRVIALGLLGLLGRFGDAVSITVVP
jgi:uncharacterized repeat protein (TIGR01451 family)